MSVLRPGGVQPATGPEPGLQVPPWNSWRRDMEVKCNDHPSECKSRCDGLPKTFSLNHCFQSFSFRVWREERINSSLARPYSPLSFRVCSTGIKTQQTGGGHGITNHFGGFIKNGLHGYCLYWLQPHTTDGTEISDCSCNYPPCFIWLHPAPVPKGSSDHTFISGRKKCFDHQPWALLIISYSFFELQQGPNFTPSDVLQRP